MFTGIVESIGFVLEAREEGEGQTVSLRCPSVAGRAEEGESIAVNGVCLTADTAGRDVMQFHVSSETLRTTNLDRLDVGTRVNVESSLKAGEPLGGHFVMGHVDGTGQVEEVREGQEERELTVRTETDLLEMIIPRGSVALDGVSLTPVEVGEESFSVVLIPETLDRTTLGQIEPKDQINIEVDLLARYVKGILDGDD